jgi:hypothetical protein
MASARGPAYCHRVKHKKFAREQYSNSGAGLKQNEIDFAPSLDTVAKKSNFIPVNQGSSHGHEVRHWLQAEAQLIAERKSARAQEPGAK